LTTLEELMAEKSAEITAFLNILWCAYSQIRVPAFKKVKTQNIQPLSLFLTSLLTIKDGHKSHIVRDILTWDQSLESMFLLCCCKRLCLSIELTCCAAKPPTMTSNDYSSNSQAGTNSNITHRTLHIPRRKTYVYSCPSFVDEKDQSMINRSID
jgi:hypothetical protein